MNKRQKKKKNPVKYRIIRTQKRYLKAMIRTTVSVAEAIDALNKLQEACKDVPYIE